MIPLFIPIKLPNVARTLTVMDRDKHILSVVKKNKLTVYGGQAIRKRIGFYARQTYDYDIISKTPSKSARELETKLDKSSKGDYYYTKPAMHPGTYKVMSIGNDNKKGTKDDIGIADFTKPSRNMNKSKINDVYYVSLSEVVKDKRKSIRDPEFTFRHAKDKDDLLRIRFARQMQRITR